MSLLRTRVKMCGMTRDEDIKHAVDLGVDALGFIFYPKSARYVSLDRAQVLLKSIPLFVDTVAVLVNPEPGFVKQLINELPIQLLQFHGDESPEFCSQFQKPFIKAIHPSYSEHIVRAVDEFSLAQAILLDTPSNVRGGSGLTFDWQIIPKIRAKPFILAGGLNECNVSTAIRLVKPYAIDVCSGIEASPGVKDHLKMSQFIKALRGEPINEY